MSPGLLLSTSGSLYLHIISKLPHFYLIFRNWTACPRVGVFYAIVEPASSKRKQNFEKCPQSSTLETEPLEVSMGDSRDEAMIIALLNMLPPPERALMWLLSYLDREQISEKLLEDLHPSCAITAFFDRGTTQKPTQLLPGKLGPGPCVGSILLSD